MEFTDYMLWKLVALAVIAGVIGWKRGAKRRK
jgi:hypothetical protein